MTIPNLAIHMNREINKSYEIDPQVDTIPLLGLKGQLEGELLNLLAQELDLAVEEILDFDLYLYPREKSAIFGIRDEFLSAPRLDNLSLAYASIEALTSAENPTGINLIAITDNEEVGSTSRQGADSPMIRNTLWRIYHSLGKTEEDYHRALEESFMISADMAHALHPSHPSSADPTNYPILGSGPTIKTAANKSYTTDGYSASVFKEICKRAGVPVQEFTNRSGKPGGSTIGPVTSSYIDIPAIDVGTPSLAMHSIREIIALADQTYITKAFIEFFSY